MLNYFQNQSNIRQGRFYLLESDEWTSASCWFNQFQNSVAATILAILAYADSTDGLQHVHYVNNACCITPNAYPVLVRKGLFAGVMSEHQHLASLINFKTVWQPQYTSTILAY